MSEPTPAAASCCEENARLQLSIVDMNSLAQEGLAEIASLARLVFRTMEHGNSAPRDLDDMMQGLHLIWSRADEMRQTIGDEAGRGRHSAS